MNTFSNVPIIINNFNRLKTVDNMVGFFSNADHTNIIILDNQSTYPPLLKWYEMAEKCIEGVKVVRLPHNMGAHALYECNILQSPEVLHSGFEVVIYTDPDLELNPNMPKNFAEIMYDKMIKHHKCKIGLALKIDDIPENAFLGRKYLQHEAQFWVNEVEPDLYDANVDTTFCMLWKPNSHIYESLRIAGDFTARHIPWYTNFEDMSDEEEFYLRNSSYISTYKCEYDAWKSRQASA